jgi:hypothetical protein
MISVNEAARAAVANLALENGPPLGIDFPEWNARLNAHIEHFLNCGGPDDCSCLERRRVIALKVALGTERTMHEAWRKRAEEAEVALAAAERQRETLREAADRVTTYLEFVYSRARSLPTYAGSQIHDREDGIEMAIRAARAALAGRAEGVRAALGVDGA